MRRLLRAVAWLCAAAALALILRTCVFGLVKVACQSMENTLETGDVALVSRLDYRLGSIRRGDVAQIRVPGRDGTYLKRVVGLPGEKVELSGGRVFIDGRALEEDYINERTYLEEGTEFPLTVPEGSIFVMGDNRNRSSDSRDSRLGTVDARYVIGKAVFMAFPGADEVTGKKDLKRIGVIA